VIDAGEGRDHRREEGCVLHHLAYRLRQQDVPSDLLDRPGVCASAGGDVNPGETRQTT
jgi:hypothetical protein